MGKGTPRAPTPPDYNAAARAQGVENIATARAQAKLNTPNTYTPYGNQTVSWAQPVFDQKGFNTATASLARPSLTDAKYGGAVGSGTLKAAQEKYDLGLSKISQTTGGVFDPVKYNEYLAANPQTYNQGDFDLWQTGTTTAINNLPRSGARGAFNQGAYDDAVSAAQAAFEEGPAYGNFYPPNSDSDEFYFPSTKVDSTALNKYYTDNPTKTLQDFPNQSTTTKLQTDPYFMTGGGANPNYATQVAAYINEKGQRPDETMAQYQTGAFNQGLYDTDKAAYDSTISNIRNTYTSFADSDTPTVTQTLTPDAERALKYQQKIEAGLSQSAFENALPTIQNAMRTKFDTSGYDLRRDLGPQDTMNYGPAMGAYGLSGSVGPGSFGYAGGLGAGQYGLAQGGVAGPTIQSDFGGYGGVQDSPFGGQYGQAGGINSGQFGNLMTGANMSGVAAMPVSAGMTGQQAIMSRLQPQLERQAAATAQQLANQGITPGSEAYNNAMREQQQGQNDLLSQAALQGIGLDMSANQQGYGQAMGQAGLYNQAMGQGFGQGFQAQQLGNQAIGQNFGQGMQSNAAQNAAQAQRYGQAAGNAQFGNEAQLSQFQANLANQQAGNQAVAQNYGQGMSSQELQNRAASQNYGQGITSQNQANAAMAQNYAQAAASAGLYNQAAAQKYNQALGAAQFYNQGQQQQLQQNLALRNQPLNEIMGLLSGAQIQTPQFQGYAGGGNIQAAPVFQGVQQQGQAAMDMYGLQANQAAANSQGMMGMLGSVAGAAGMAF